MMLSVIMLSIIGLGTCLYGLYVEMQLAKNANFQAACDLSERASCTKTFLSPWGKVLGISNIRVGILFYVGMLILGILHQTCLAFLGAIGACVGSILLAYILYAKVKTLCLICTTIYVVNGLLFWATYDCL